VPLPVERVLAGSHRGCVNNTSNQCTTGDQSGDELTWPVNVSTTFAAIASAPLKRRQGMTDTVPLSGNRILSFIERIERIDEELKELSEGKKASSSKIPATRNRKSSLRHAARTILLKNRRPSVSWVVVRGNLLRNLLWNPDGFPGGGFGRSGSSFRFDSRIGDRLWDVDWQRTGLMSVDHPHSP